MTVLIVDDLQDNRELLRQMLEDHSIGVILAEDGAAALRTLHDQEVELVLLDIMMPVMDGLEVLRRMRADDALRRIPAIVVTAHSEEGLLAEAFAHGAMDYIRKPVMEEELLARVRSALALKAAQDALRRKSEEVVRLNSLLATSNARLENEAEGLRQERAELLEQLRIVPVLERPSGAATLEQPAPLPSGRCYLVTEERPLRGILLFATMVHRGQYGLCFTRRHPREVRAETALQQTPLVWLTNSQEPDIPCINGQSLARISSTIGEFLEQTKDGVIYIEGINYLVSQSGFESVLNLVQLVNDRVMTSDDRVILSVNPAALEARQLALLWGECAPLPEVWSGALDAHLRSRSSAPLPQP